MKNELPKGWPEISPIYDIHRSYLDNLNEGPFFTGTIPKRDWIPRDQWIDFLGFKVASPLGVPAGPLLNGRWVVFAAQMGFDIVTYKTIRSKPQTAHPAPNMIYVDTHGALSHSRANETLIQSKIPPLNMESLAATNSFGIPSMDADYLIGDIAAANNALAPGQVMIVSIVGTPREGEDFYEDFALAAGLALAGGAQIIEADLSCPNVSTCEGSLFTNAESIAAIAKKMKKVIGSVPLIIKVGVIEDEKILNDVMQAAARSGVQAICGINTMSMKVVNEQGVAALGEKRLKAGVCGAPIRNVALDFVRKSSEINKKEKLDLTIMGTGGAVLSEHFDLFLEAGADVAMSGIGMMWDPYLAARYHQLKLAEALV